MKLFRIVRHHLVMDYLRLGWVARPTLEGTHHAEWSVMMEWLCPCNALIPMRDRHDGVSP